MSFSVTLFKQVRDKIFARQIAVNAGLPYETPGMTVNEVCGSGLKSIILGKQLIQLGEANVVAVGGVESMTNTPDLILKKATHLLKVSCMMV